MELPSTFTSPTYVMSEVCSFNDEPFSDALGSNANKSILTEIRLGDTVYPLRFQCESLYIPGKGEFLVEGFSPMFVGRGESEVEAKQNWQLAVHAKFQELLNKRPFEMSPADHGTWDVLSSRIDVAVYRNQTPIRVRQFGQISEARPYPQKIRWESGELEPISPQQVNSADFITFKAGQPFEALVERDALDFKLLRIVHIERQSKPTRLSPEKECALLEAIGSAKTLPMVDWE